MSTPAIAPISCDHAPGTADDRVRGDPALGRLHTDDPALLDVDAGDHAALPDVGATRVPLDDALRGQVAVELAEGRREQAFGIDLRHDRQRLVDRELARRHSETVLQRERGPEALDVGLVVEEEQVAVLSELDAVHPLELVERAQRDADVQLVGELRPEAAG